MRLQRRQGLTAVVLAAALVAGCQKTKTAEETGSESPGTPEPAVRIAEVELGRGVNSAHQIEQPTADFSPNDTIYVSVKTENTPAASTIHVRWVYTGGGEEQTVSEDTHTTAAAGTGYTSFFIANPNPWPAGSYEVRIGIGQEEETKTFSVKG